MAYPIKLTERFWSKVEKSTECWNWTASRVAAGYGMFFLGKDQSQKFMLAHRFAYILAHGRIGDGMVIDHICHNKACVNPAHLRAVSQKQNCEHHAGANSSNRSSGVRGVTWDKSRRLWSTQVMHNRRNHTAGRFAELSDATAAVMKLRNELHTCNDIDRA